MTGNNRRRHMRKSILIVALVLVSATAQAGVTRGLTLASNEQVAAEQPQAVEAPRAVEAPKAAETPKPLETPKYVERPAATVATTPAPAADPAKPVAEQNTRTTKSEKPKRKRESTEDHVIRELHRHGIYW
jgi:outer membrane biosynthesis protein TonB